jgi:uncharacterized protein
VAGAVIGGRIATEDPAGTAARTARHFAHKVEVEADGDVHRVHIPAGTFELEPAQGEVLIRLFPGDGASLPRLREVVASHVERFERSGGAVEWSG